MKEERKEELDELFIRRFGMSYERFDSLTLQEQMKLIEHNKLNEEKKKESNTNSKKTSSLVKKISRIINKK